MRKTFLTTGLLLLSTLTACKDNAPASPPSTPPPAAPAAATPPPAETQAAATPPPPAEPPAPAESPAEAPMADAKPAEHGASAAPRTRPPGENPGPWQKKALAGKDLFATLTTTQGSVVVKLYSQKSPLTVANFVGLATGEQQWKDPRSGEVKKGTPLYKDVLFHRIISGFMIQGGDPLGQGIGSPGYEFENETKNGLSFDKPGILAMANHGPDTNGSQFFISVAPLQRLDGGYTIFGEVVKGYEVVEKMSQVKTGARDRPETDVVLKKVTLSDTQPK